MSETKKKPRQCNLRKSSGEELLKQGGKKSKDNFLQKITSASCVQGMNGM